MKLMNLKEFTHHDLLVLLILVNHMPNVFPGYKALIKEGKMNRHTVSTSLKKLITMGFIAKDEQGQKKSTTYVINTEAIIQASQDGAKEAQVAVPALTKTSAKEALQVGSKEAHEVVQYKYYNEVPEPEVEQASREYITDEEVAALPLAAAPNTETLPAFSNVIQMPAEVLAPETTSPVQTDIMSIFQNLLERTSPPVQTGIMSLRERLPKDCSIKFLGSSWAVFKAGESSAIGYGTTEEFAIRLALSRLKKVVNL